MSTTRTLRITPVKAARVLCLASTLTPEVAVWSLHENRTLRKWQDGATTSIFVLDTPYTGLHIAHSRIALFHEKIVSLFELPEEMYPLEEPCWKHRSTEAIRRAFVIAPNVVELYTLETSGPPYDRAGHRMRFDLLTQSHERLASAWGEPPRFGAEGIQPQPEVHAPRFVLDVPEGILRIYQENTDLTRVEFAWRDDATSSLTIPARTLRGASFVPQTHETSALFWSPDRLWWWQEGEQEPACLAVEEPTHAAGVNDWGLVQYRQHLAVLRRT